MMRAGPVLLLLFATAARADASDPATTAASGVGELFKMGLLGTLLGLSIIAIFVLVRYTLAQQIEHKKEIVELTREVSKLMAQGNLLMQQHTTLLERAIDRPGDRDRRREP